jgi:hypothetical protein
LPKRLLEEKLWDGLPIVCPFASLREVIGLAVRPFAAFKRCRFIPGMFPAGVYRKVFRLSTFKTA